VAPADVVPADCAVSRYGLMAASGTRNGVRFPGDSAAW